MSHKPQPSMSLMFLPHFDILDVIYHCYHPLQHRIYLFHTIKRQNVANGEVIYVTVLQQILRTNKTACIIQLIIKITISLIVDGFKKLLVLTNSLAKLLSDSLLSDSLLSNSSISQSHSKLWFKSTNHNLVTPLSGLECKFSLSFITWPFFFTRKL